MELAGVELVLVSIPMRRPWASAVGTFSRRDSLLVRVVLRERGGGAAGGSEVEGWGECAALPGPGYSGEYTAGSAAVSEQYLVPALLAAGVGTAAGVGPALSPVRGHKMAKTAFEAAVLDAELRAAGVRMADHLAGLSRSGGPPRAAVPAGVAVGLAGTTGELVDEVAGYVDAGYRRVKLKIGPGRDVEMVAAVRRAWPELLLVVDANGAYEALGADGAAARLKPLDDLGLACIEQPLGAEDLGGHAALARKLGAPICLDEALTSYHLVEAALDLGACSVVNIKAGRLGGYLEAVRAHDLCAGRGAPVWCGGMVETGIARACNLALAALPNFRVPGDISATGRFFEVDLTSPLPLGRDGAIAVPQGAGSGVSVDHAAVKRFSTWRRWWPAR